MLVHTFRLRDAIDILVVALVLYRVFVMFKETRAVQMLLGLGALMAASFFANRFELYGTSWILDNFWSFWVLALIVLFQPELRRALAQFGQNPFFRAMTRAGREQQSHLLDEVAPILARYAFHLAGAWRWIYAVTAMVSLYLNIFVLIIQGFLKVPSLTALAPLTLLNARSTRPAQLAQVMPLMGRSNVMESDIGRTPCRRCLQDQPCHAGKVKRQFPLPAARLFA